MRNWIHDVEAMKMTHTGCQAEGQIIGCHHVMKRWNASTPPYQDEVRWIQLTTLCSRGQVITLDLPQPSRDTLSPHPILTPAPSLAPLTPATSLGSRTHDQGTLVVLILATTPTQAPSKEGPYVRMCLHLPPRRYVDFGTTL